MLTEWNEIEIDFGRDRVRFVRDLPPEDDVWKDAKDRAVSIIEDKIERKVKNAFLLFSEMKDKEREYLKKWLGRKYRYFIWGGLLRIFLVFRTDGKIRIFQVKGEDVLGLFSDCGYQLLGEAGFDNGTAIFPAYYEDPETGKEKKIRVMLRVAKPACGCGTKGENSISIISKGKEIARGHFAEGERLAKFSRWRCELICQT